MMNRFQNWKTVVPIYISNRNIKYRKLGRCLCCNRFISADFDFDYQYCKSCYDTYGENVIFIKRSSVRSKLKSQVLCVSSELLEELVDIEINRTALLREVKEYKSNYKKEEQ